jgi:hypothetical protein
MLIRYQIYVYQITKIKIIECLNKKHELMTLIKQLQNKTISILTNNIIQERPTTDASISAILEDNRSAHTE